MWHFEILYFGDLIQNLKFGQLHSIAYLLEGGQAINLNFDMATSILKV